MLHSLALSTQNGGFGFMLAMREPRPSDSNSSLGQKFARRLGVSISVLSIPCDLEPMRMALLQVLWGPGGLRQPLATFLRSYDCFYWGVSLFMPI